MGQRLRQLQFCHESDDCEGTPVPRSLFLTSKCELLVVAGCKDCGAEFQVRIPMEQLISACPGTPRIARKPLFTADDAAFLEEMHIEPDLRL